MKEFGRNGSDFHKLRTRRAGGSLYVDLHMGFKPGMSLEQGHDLSHRLTAQIEEALPGAKVLVHLEPSNIIETLPEEEEQVRCMREELLKDQRVCEVSNLKVTRYRGDMRIEADLSLDPKVSLAESHAVASDLKMRLESCFPEVTETSLSFHPGDGWQNAFHDDDSERIRVLWANMRATLPVSMSWRSCPQEVFIAFGLALGCHLHCLCQRLMPYSRA